MLKDNKDYRKLKEKGYGIDSGMGLIEIDLWKKTDNGWVIYTSGTDRG